jgi:rhodanese-related sulfurtransferase
MTEPEANDTEISPERASELIAGGAQLVDVRQDYEWEAGHIKEASHIVLESLPARAEELDRERPIVFACRTGSRSSFATTAFREAGFEAYNLAGGLVEWVEEGREIEPADGEVAGPRPDLS